MGAALTIKGVTEALESVIVASTVIEELCLLATVAPMTVAVTPLPAVYTSTPDVPTEALTAFLNTLAINYPKAIANDTDSSVVPKLVLAVAALVKSLKLFVLSRILVSPVAPCSQEDPL